MASNQKSRRSRPPRTPQQRTPGRPSPRAITGTVVADDDDMAVLQGLIEGAPAPDPDGSLEFMGERFRVAEVVGTMPLLKFAAATAGGAVTGDLEAMRAMYALIRDCVHPGTPPCGQCQACYTKPAGCPWGGDCEFCDADPDDNPDPRPWLCVAFNKATCPAYDPGDFERFERHAIDTKADDTELMKFVGQVMAATAERPTKPQGGSSPSPRSISPNSRARSSSPAIDLGKHPQAAGLRPVADLLS